MEAQWMEGEKKQTKVELKKREKSAEERNLRLRTDLWGRTREF